MRPLAIIDSDAAHAARLRATFEAEGFRTDVFGTGTSALSGLRSRAYALLILGLDVRDLDPYALCREVSPLVPVITIARDCATDACTRSLESGADDCVVQTTSPRELIARIRSVLRRTPQPSGTLAISLSEMRVRTGGTTHDLTRGEAELLAVLVRHSPTPVPTSRLTEILGERRNTVESRIKSLRRKLGPERLVSRGTLGYEVVEE